MNSPESRQCACCAAYFTFDEAHQAFLEMVSPIISGQKQLIPPPKFCAPCRMQRRLAFRNPITMGWRTCATSGKRVLSAYPLESRCQILENSLWWGDSWSALDFGRPYNPQAPFFTQLGELRQKVPYAACRSSNCENCDYCSNIDRSRDCYFTFNTLAAESVLYGDYVWGSKDCLDCTRTSDAELCYDCIEAPRCYNLQSSEFCSDCRDSIFLSHCRSCSDCFGCWNLAHKRFCVFNQQFSEQEYREFVGNLDLSSYLTRQQWKSEWITRKRLAPRPHQYSLRSDNCRGNFLENCTRVHDSFYIIDGEDLRYCFILNKQVKNCYDYSHFGNRAENIYECQSVGHGAFQLLFCVDCVNDNTDLMYCVNCVGCHDCFGCVGLRNQRYCFLNRSYSKSEYEALVGSAITKMVERGEWGEFFPLTLSPYPYNVSFAQRYFPLTREQLESRELDWYDLPELDNSASSGIGVLSDALPEDSAPLTTSSILSTRPFRITPLEIEKCKQFQVPLPRETYAERMEQRWAQLGGIRLFERVCAKSGRKLLTSLDPDLAPVVWEREEWEKEIW